MQLSKIERDTLQCLSEGLKWAEIAKRLHSDELSIKNASRRAFAKLGCYQLKAVCKAIRLGIIRGPSVPRSGLRRLTKHQWQICRAVHEGLTNKEIGERFSITEFTAKTHLQQIFEKLTVRSRSQLAAIVEIVTSHS